VHDIVVQAREKHLLVGTHGRSIFKADISHLAGLATDLAAGKKVGLQLFELEAQRTSARWGTARGFGDPYTPELPIDFFAPSAGAVKISVKDSAGIEVNSFGLVVSAGFNSAAFHMNFSKEGKLAFLKKNKMALALAADGNTYLPKGSYAVTVSLGGQESKQVLLLE
jgi:hypothetical protein